MINTFQQADLAGFSNAVKAAVRCSTVFLAMLVPVTAVAQPGATPPPGLLIKVETAGRLREGQASELVYLQKVTVSDLQPFESSSGRTHLTFSVDVGGERFAAIMYDGEWGDTDQTRLGTGTVDLIGLWDDYNGAPSLVTKWVEVPPAASSETTTENAVASDGELLVIDNATISDVSKFVDKSLKMHVRFLLRAQGDERLLPGLVYEGHWDSDTLTALRSGTADLVGHWDENEQAPVFVVQQVE